MRNIVNVALLLVLTLWTGCATQKVVGTSKSPVLVIEDSGTVTFNHQPIQPSDVGAALKSAGYKKSQEINILVPDKPDRAAMKAVSADLVRHGYNRTVFVKNRKAYATITKP